MSDFTHKQTVHLVVSCTHCQTWSEWADVMKYNMIGSTQVIDRLVCRLPSIGRKEYRIALESLWRLVLKSAIFSRCINCNIISLLRLCIGIYIFYIDNKYIWISIPIIHYSQINWLQGLPLKA